MEMPGRKFDAGTGYRYGFNGKENDNETTSTTTYDYGFRIYNPALGRFLSVDPLTAGYPYFTPYQFASNSPISSVDIDGMEADKEYNNNEKLGDGIGFIIKQKVTEFSIATRVLANMHPVTKFAIKSTQQITKQMVVREATVLHRNATDLDNAHKNLQEFYHKNGFYSLEFASFEQRIDLSYQFNESVEGLHVPDLTDASYSSLQSHTEGSHNNGLTKRSHSFDPVPLLTANQNEILSNLMVGVNTQKDIYSKQHQKFTHLNFIRLNGEDFKLTAIMSDIMEFVANQLNGPQKGDKEALEEIEKFFNKKSTVKQKEEAFGKIIDSYLKNASSETSYKLNILNMEKSPEDE